jgi:hypothetical protein
MEPDTNSSQAKDPGLWAIAKRRAGFKRDLAIYFFVNAFLWIVWLLTDNHDKGDIPWPIWPTAGWGLAMLIQYVEVYRFPKENATEREYKKLKRKYNQ